MNGVPALGTPFAAPTANNTYVSLTTQMRTVLLPPLAPSPAIQLAAPPPQLVHPAPAPQPSPPTSNSAAIGTGVAAAAPADSKEATQRTTRPPANPAPSWLMTAATVVVQHRRATGQQVPRPPQQQR